MAPIRDCIKALEKLSLVSCSEDVLRLLERSIGNIKPMLEVDVRNQEPLIWQNYLKINRLHPDKAITRLNPRDVKENAPKFVEDYVAVGHIHK